MGWFGKGILRTWIRRNMNPIHPDKARKRTNILSAIYFLTAWHGLAYCVYVHAKREAPDQKEDESSPSYFARILGTGDATVYRVNSTGIAESYAISGITWKEKGKSNEERRREEKEERKRLRREQRLKDKEKRERELARQARDLSFQQSGEEIGEVIKADTEFGETHKWEEETSKRNESEDFGKKSILDF